MLRPLLGAIVLWLAGCTDGDRMNTAAEIDEPAYREGQALLKSGRRQEALAAFLKVIDKRGEDAAESHLEAGLLYLEHINDPLSAIYHFRRYLALRPNSPQAPLVKQRIDAATRDFARTLPAQPLENQLQRVDLVATLDKLKKENESLKQELADAKAGRAAVELNTESSTIEPAVPTVATAVPASNSVNFNVDTGIPAVRTRPAPVAPPRATAPSPAKPQTATTAKPTLSATKPVTASRTHTVQKGDTLFKLAQQYYVDRSKWRDIYAANRGVMKNESDLSVGKVLKIP